ncbi:DUF3458 domain-containing protein, partial [bacterium]|nr:DUF3458 domain-containing protein [bacterium]
MNSRAVKRLADVRVLKEIQFTEDAGPMAHPIQPDSYIEINNFYTATVYNKGAEIIRMMATLAGRDGFRAGTDLYFTRHDGQAVTTEAFIKSIEDGSKTDLSQFRNWYHQAGTPWVEAGRMKEVRPNVYELTLRQHCRPTPESAEKRPFVIPIRFGLIDAKTGAPLQFSIFGICENTFETVLPFKTNSAQFEIHCESTGIPSLLREFSAPVILNYPYTESEKQAIFLADSDPYNRYEAGQSLLESVILQSATTNTVFIPESIIECIRRLVTDTTLDPAFAALSLQLPSLNRLLDASKGFPITELDVGRKAVYAELGQQLLQPLLDRYNALSKPTVYEPNALQIGQRRLKNTILQIIVDANPHLSELATKQ